MRAFSSHSFWTSSSLDVPAEVTQEEGHTGFFIHLPSAVRALIFLSLGIFFFFFFTLVRKIPFTGIESTSQRFRRLRGYLWATGATGVITVYCYKHTWHFIMYSKGFCFVFVWCSCMAINNVSVQHMKQEKSSFFPNMTVSRRGLCLVIVAGTFNMPTSYQ